MLQGMDIAPFTCCTFLSTEHDIFSPLSEHYKIKNLLAKVEKVWTILSVTFFNLEEMIHYLVIISIL